tara:strand:+ start:807 stop:935 length:129 start_codon:yes stop_codon:yes gene_type:complete
LPTEHRQKEQLERHYQANVEQSKNSQDGSKTTIQAIKANAMI